MAEAIDQFRGDYRIEVQEIDLLEQPEVALQYGILATPALLINGRLAFVGSAKERDLREKLAVAAKGAV